MSDFAEKPSHPADLLAEGGTQSIEQPLEQNEVVSIEEEGDDSLILSGKALAIAFIGLLSAVFLTSLDQTIISPALPIISSKFNALDKIAWLPSAYILSQTTFLLLYGQIMTVFDRKWTFFGAVVLFEIGSLICAVANSIDLLIFGRAVAGLGASGVYVGNTVIIADITTLEQRPRLLGLFGVVLVLASILGPIIGGAFTQHVTWRWVFYINLPLGVITLSAIAVTLKPTPPGPLSQVKIAAVERRLDFFRLPHGSFIRPTIGSFIYRGLTLDWTGGILGFGAVFMLLLGFQWGGSTYRWDSSIIIGLLVGCGATSVVWILYERFIGNEHALMPLRFCRNRSVCGSSGSSFFSMLVLFVATYYLPLQFQAVQGDSATSSGLRLLPYLLGTVVCAALAGALVSRIGRYWHVIFLSPALTSIGFGLMYTFSPTTSDSKVIGYQILASMGTGCLLQNSVIALQANVDQRDIPQATAFQTFFQRLGGIIGISIAGTVFANELAKNLDKFAPGAPKALLLASVEVIKTLPESQQIGAIKAYSKAIDEVYLIAVPAGFLSMVAALFIRDVNVKGRKFGSAAAPEKVEKRTEKNSEDESV